jgi:hypothetical protein
MRRLLKRLDRQSNEWVGQLNTIVNGRRSHVLRKQLGDSCFETGAEQHAIPMRKAMPSGEVKRAINYARRGQHKGKNRTDGTDVPQQDRTRNATLILPSPELTKEFAGDLPQ